MKSHTSRYSRRSAYRKRPNMKYRYRFRRFEPARGWMAFRLGRTMPPTRRGRESKFGAPHRSSGPPTAISRQRCSSPRCRGSPIPTSHVADAGREAKYRLAFPLVAPCRPNSEWSAMGDRCHELWCVFRQLICRQGIPEMPVQQPSNMTKLLLSFVFVGIYWLGVGCLSPSYSQEATSGADTQGQGFEVSFAPGARDQAGNFMGGTEVRTLVGHAGKLFAGNGYWEDAPGPEGVQGAEISCFGRAERPMARGPRL